MRPWRSTQRPAEDNGPDTPRWGNPAGPYDPYAAPERRPDDGGRQGGRQGTRQGERRDSYLTWLVIGLVSPFVLALPLYPLLWLPVSAVAVPVAGALRALLSAIFGIFAPGGPSGDQAGPTPGGPGILDPAFWDFGPLVTPPVALTSAAATLLAWFVLSGVVGRRHWWHAEGTSKRGFRAGLRVALLAFFLLAVWWANRTLAAS